jgi:hypothetical protein
MTRQLYRRMVPRWLLCLPGRAVLQTYGYSIWRRVSTGLLPKPAPGVFGRTGHLTVNGSPSAPIAERNEHVGMVVGNGFNPSRFT